MKLRAPTIEDAPGIVAAMNALSRSLYGADEVSLPELRAWFSTPDFDPERDALVAVADDGSILAYADLADPSDEGRRLWLDVHVPAGDHPELAGALFDELEARALERVAPDGSVKVPLPSVDTAMAALVEARGYRVTRHSFRMEADLAGETEAPLWPPGIAVRTFRPGEDDERVYETQEETFADQFDATPLSYETWRVWNFSEPFDPDLWFLAEQYGELAGVCLCHPERAGDETVGWVSVLGVRRPWRRRGLGRALLLHAFGELRLRGKARAGLGVDASNPTGAVSLYEQAGMRVAQRIDHWEKPSSG